MGIQLKTPAQIAKLRETIPEITHDVNFLLQVLRN